MTQKRMQLSVFAVAALAIIAVAAVMLLAGGGSARADTTTFDPSDYVAPEQGGGATPTPTPTPTPRTHATPEPCPGETGNSNTLARAVDSGHIALFDVWWNDEEGELTNTSCPPIVAYDTATESTQRSPSSINIEETVIHIPNGAKVTLNETNYPKEKYPDLWEADDKENPGGEGDRIVWALPACPPEGTPATNGLCLSFSAALLNAADWTDSIVYRVHHVHQIDIDKQDPRYVLAYDGVSGRNQLRWDSSNANFSNMLVPAGGYDRPMWFFTDRGTYEFQVNITGNPNQAQNPPVSKDASVTSDVREYILHVGAEADLGITTMEVTPASPSPGNNVTVRVTANNVGPDEAPETKVDVTLPEGLSYASHVAASGTSYSSGVWTIGNLAKDASKTLTVTATVDAGTHGQELTAKAAISATETVEEIYQVSVLDPNPSNNMRTGAITVASSANGAPAFTVMCSVNEFAATGAKVCDPVSVKDPNAGDTLTYGLTGAGANHFAAQSVDGGVKVVVAQGANLQQVAGQSFALNLTVSDGKDAAGNADPSVDDSIAVMIEVLDFTVSLTPSSTSVPVGQSVTFTVRVENSPVPASQLWHTWFEQESRAGSRPEESTGQGNPGTLTESRSTAGDWVYEVAFFYLEGDQKRALTSSGEISVTWHN